MRDQCPTIKIESGYGKEVRNALLQSFAELDGQKLTKADALSKLRTLVERTEDLNSLGLNIGMDGVPDGIVFRPKFKVDGIDVGFTLMCSEPAQNYWILPKGSISLELMESAAKPLD